MRPNIGHQRRGISRAGGWPLVAAGIGCVLALGCAEMRQNLRNQDLSFRGGWFCTAAGCDEANMQRSTKARRDGETNVVYGKLQPAAAMAFYPGSQVQSFTASVSCGANQVEVPGDQVKAPGSHGISGQTDSWVVVVDPATLDGIDAAGCKTMMVKATATWTDGATYTAQAGIEAQ